MGSLLWVATPCPLDHEIDTLVNELYGLSDKAIATVEGGMKAA